MYRIIENLDKTYTCEVVIQDGTERWTETDLERAKKAVKNAAMIFNGTKIKKKDVELYRIEEIKEVKLVRIN